MTELSWSIVSEYRCFKSEYKSGFVVALGGKKNEKMKHFWQWWFQYFSCFLVWFFFHHQVSPKVKIISVAWGNSQRGTGEMTWKWADAGTRRCRPSTTLLLPAPCGHLHHATKLPRGPQSPHEHLSLPMTHIRRETSCPEHVLSMRTFNFLLMFIHDLHKPAS